MKTSLENSRLRQRPAVYRFVFHIRHLCAFFGFLAEARASVEMMKPHKQHTNGA